MTEEKATVGGAVRYAFSLYGHGFRAIWGALALSALADTVQAAGFFAYRPEVRYAGAVAGMLTTALVVAAVCRLGLAQRHGTDPAWANGRAGLQWRPMEWRVLFAGLLVMVFVGFILVLIVLAALAILAGTLQASDIKAIDSMTPAQLQAHLGTGGLNLLYGLMLAGVLLMLFLGSRLALSGPATVDANRVRVLQTWKLTGRLVLPIIAAWLLINLPIGLISDVVSQVILQAGGASDDVDLKTMLMGGAVQSASAESVLGAALITGFISGAVLKPLTTGALLYFYRIASTPAPPRNPVQAPPPRP